MFRFTTFCYNCGSKTYSRLNSHNRRLYSKNPIAKTIDVISRDIPFLSNKDVLRPKHADVVIIGGGFIGSSVAYSLKARAGNGLSVVVLEKDLDIAQQNTLGSIIQHYSLPENIYLSQYCSEFLRNHKENLGNDIDIQYQPYNYLVLACDKYAHKLEETVTTLKELGTKIELLTPSEIKHRYPWINVNDIKLGSVGLESEGTFNSWAFLNGLVKKSKELGALYVQSEVVGFELEQQRDLLMEGVTPGSFERINKVVYRTDDNEEHSIKFAACVLAAGSESGEIAKHAKIGTDHGLLSVPLPIKQRECKMYSVEDKEKKIRLNSPFVMDTSGLWMKRNGLKNSILCGSVPLMSDDAETLADGDYIKNVIKPCLENRVPDLNHATIKEVSNEIFDNNTFDETAILGPHPYHTNLYIAAGFGKQACFHAPGVGRAITELIIDSNFTTIDLTRFNFDRILTDQPLLEFNVY